MSPALVFKKIVAPTFFGGFVGRIILGVMASTRGTDLQAVIDAIEAKELDAKIACVVSNKEDCFALERAKSYGIEAIFLDPKKFESKEGFDEKVIELFNAKKVELILLIGYNKFLSKPFLDEFKEKAMNIHPSLLPAFKGWDLEMHKSVLEYGCKVSGCTLFFITEEPDAGPIILQRCVPIEEGETAESLKVKVQVKEKEIILEGIRLFKEGRLSVKDNRVKISR